MFLEKRLHTGRQCMLFREEEDDLHHAFISCPATLKAGLAVLGYLQKLSPGLSPECALRLQVEETLCDVEELAVSYTLGTGLKFIWEARIKKTRVEPYKIRAELEALVL